MPKQIITERDIEEMSRQGKMSLDLTDDIVLTELAYEMARKLGFRLGKSDPGSPAAPIRPYLSQMPKTPAAPVQSPAVPAPAVAPKIPDGAPCAFCQGKAELDLDALRQRVRKAAIAKMGDRMDAALIDTIIDRVLNNIGLTPQAGFRRS
jgi:hypothetical protein